MAKDPGNNPKKATGKLKPKLEITFLFCCYVLGFFLSFLLQLFWFCNYLFVTTYVLLLAWKQILL